MNDWYPGAVMCCVCFGRCEYEDCYIDKDGIKWDFHKKDCAWQALGLDEVDYDGNRR